MADINRDLDRYLRRRRSQKPGYTGDSWFDRIFSSAEQEEAEEISPEEAEQLDELEHEIEEGEKRIEVVHDIEEDLEEEQEQRVGLYHQVLRLFQRDEEPEEEDVDVPEEDEAEDDFRTLAEIQVKWLSRLPLRARQTFKDSEDYQKMVEIYERRGVARRK